MAIGTRHVITKFDSNAVSHLNDNLDSLSALKLESRWVRDVSGTSATDRTSNFALTSYPFQSMEFGTYQVSGVGSQAICSTFILKENYDSILYAQAHARHTKISAHVISLTSGSNGWLISIEARAFETATFSGVTTNAVTVNYQVVGAPPRR